MGEMSDPKINYRKETYKGHTIVFSDDKRRKQIFIDGRRIRYGSASGQYYLAVYAYDRAPSLEEVVKRYLDYKERTKKRAGKGA